MANLTAPTTGQLPANVGTIPSTHIIAGHVAGEALPIGVTPCYIKLSDNKVYKSNGTGANEAAKVHGWACCARAVPINEAITLYFDVDVQYATADTLAVNDYFVATTAGLLADAATTGGTKAVATVLDASNKILRLWQSRY